MKKFFIPLFFVILSCGIHELIDETSSSSLSSSSSSSHNLNFNFSSSSSSSPSYDNNTDEEMKLYNLMMEYREELDLPRIPISKALTYVAQTHVKDLQENFFSYEPLCDGHSWSDKGDWSPCCYNEKANKSCVRDKPRELTSYKGHGYEIVYRRTYTDVTAEMALDGWRNSSSNATIANADAFENITWNAIGIGISGAFAVAWFGQEPEEQFDGNDDDPTKYKVCVSKSYGIPVCKKIDESFTYINCLSLYSEGFEPMESPPKTCIYASNQGST